MDAFFPLISTAIIYFILCRLISWALKRATAKMDASQRPREIEGVSER
jgi:polar amino acid transport system substrate-binding protein